ncbi:Toxin YoeB [Bacteroidales bacterium Barb6XT]|nr:Toxin YoeB [Bacteroidales bacterium Barb6XT]
MTFYKIAFTDEARNDVILSKKSNKQVYKKLVALFLELEEHPRTGTGKPKQLKTGKYAGMYSRRITDGHRLVYSINDNTCIVLVLSARDHYGDK